MAENVDGEACEQAEAGVCSDFTDIFGCECLVGDEEFSDEPGSVFVCID